jgi:tRNA (guanine37-N1)-methyltransferase
MFRGALEESILGRAQQRGLAEIRVHDIREHGLGRHRVTDDYSYGGGGGMVMMPEPIFAAVEAARCAPEAGCRERIILLTPQGVLFDQSLAWELSREHHLILICGRYEGVDERVAERLATDEISIGDYVLSGGEPAALVVTDAVVRLQPGALGAEEGATEDSFAQGLLEYPQYTRPEGFRGWRVPEVLLSGHHEQVRRWRREQALRRTLQRRPDLLARAPLSDEDREILERIRAEESG